jgi:hypothetical protein
MLKYLSIIFLCFYTSISSAYESENMAEVSFGVAVHNLNANTNKAGNSSGKYLGLSIGYELKHTLTLMSSIRLWHEDEDEEGSNGIFHDFNFTGLSLGLDAQFFLPGLSRGPYVKAGHHCWTAHVWQSLNPFNDTGCSKLLGAGFLWEDSSELGGSAFTEILITRFERIESWVLVYGHRF